MNQITFDGFFFTPSLEDEGMELSFFDFKEEPMKGAEKINGNAVGDMYHVAFFKDAGENSIEFDENFEAIFADPVTYVKNLEGAGLFGCVLRKTTHSHKWFDNYLTRAKENVRIQNMKTKERLKNA